MERKLENELPVEGKEYRRIGASTSEFTEGRIYKCVAEKELMNDLGECSKYFVEKVFSEKFVEVIEENVEEKIKRGSVLVVDEYERSKPYTESDIEFLDQFKTGVKHDQNKLPLYTIIFKQFPLAIQAVAKRALAGHNKYIETDADWQNFARAGEQDPDRYKNAGLRHLLEEGEDTEKGMEGTTHEAAVVWNFLADLELKIRRNEKLSK